MCFEPRNKKTIQLGGVGGATLFCGWSYTSILWVGCEDSPEMHTGAVLNARGHTGANWSSAEYARISLERQETGARGEEQDATSRATVKFTVLSFAGWLSEGTASHTAQNNTLWPNV